MGNAITHIEFTKADHTYGDVGAFLNLRTIKFDDPDAAQKFWDEIPEVEATSETDDFNYLADQWCGDCCTDNKYVSAEFIEQHISGTVDEATALALADLEIVEDQLAARFAQ